MVMEVAFIPNWMENQDSGIWCPQKSVDIHMKEAWIQQKTKILYLPAPLLSANYHALSVDNSQLYISSLIYKTV